MITHLADPTNRGWAICGVQMPSPLVSGGRRRECEACSPAKFITLPCRIAGPYCKCCGQTSGHGFGCRGEAA